MSLSHFLDPQTYSTGPTTKLHTRVAVADVNGDGKPDSSSPTTPMIRRSMSVLLGTVTARSRPQALAGGAYSPPDLADFNGDGNPDSRRRLRQ